MTSSLCWTGFDLIYSLGECRRAGFAAVLSRPTSFLPWRSPACLNGFSLYSAIRGSLNLEPI